MLILSFSGWSFFKGLLGVPILLSCCVRANLYLCYVKFIQTRQKKSLNGQLLFFFGENLHHKEAPPAGFRCIIAGIIRGKF